MSPLAKFFSIFGRLYPLYSGCLRLANSKLFYWALKQQEGVVWTRLRGGAWILIPINDWIGRAVYYFGDLDPKVTWVCKQILQPGDVVLDIGANLGLISIFSRQIVGEKGIVHAFEPQPALVNLMTQSLEKNGYSDVKVHQIALGTQKGTTELFVPEGHAGAASLIQKEHFQGNVVSVMVENASEYLSQLNLPPIRLMKIDVEGFEADVLEGASEFFATNRPDAVIFELNDYSIKFSKHAVVNKLSKLNYQFFDIPKAKFRMRLQPLDSSASKWYGHDILAIQKGENYPLIAKRVGVI